ncbi:MAG: acyl carrier protein [Streptomyces sp.]|nr:acyl carrier protein [Streptomyces sp.]
MNTESAVSDERQIAGVLERAIAEDLQLPSGRRVDRNALFVDLGLDSAGVVAVAGQAGDHLGLEIPTEWLFDHPTIADLAAFLAHKAAHPEDDRG